MQGPINKEPDEKLDPANKPTGIRKLYVLDSNNFLIVVIDIKVDDLFFSIINFIISNKINSLTPTANSISSSNLYEYKNGVEDNSTLIPAITSSDLYPSNNSVKTRSCPIRRYISSRSCDCILEKNKNRPNNTTTNITTITTKTTTNNKTNSFLSLIVVMLLNLFYLVICLKTNTILFSCFMLMFNVLMCKKVVYFVLLLIFSHLMMTRFRVKVKLKNKKRIRVKGGIFSKKKKFLTF